MLGFKQWVNKLIWEKGVKNYSKKTHKNLNDDLYSMFKNNGEGLYVPVFEGKQNNFVSKCITKISGKMSHTFLVLYKENLREMFTDKEWNLLRERWNFYYKGSNLDSSNCKVLVLGSSDESGHNYFDYSSYQNRQQCIGKISASDEEIKKIVKKCLSSKWVYMWYDGIGLFGWMFKRIPKIGKYIHKIFDDRKAHYCSERVYDSLAIADIRIAEDSEPSPTDIMDYMNKNNMIVYSNM